MAKLIDIDLRPGAHTLRSFGWIALGAFGLLALFALLGWGLFAWLPPEMRADKGLPFADIPTGHGAK